jgi:hypothetical protein
MIGQDRIMIFGSKDDGEFRTAAGGALAISVPRTEAAVLKPPRAVRAGREAGHGHDHQVC